MMKNHEYPRLSTMPPEYPPNIFGNSVMMELNTAYCTAVKEIFVRLDRKAIKAAVANPAARLSALTTRYIMLISGPICDKATKSRLVPADRIAPHNKVVITPMRVAIKPPKNP